MLLDHSAFMYKIRTCLKVYNINHSGRERELRKKEEKKEQPKTLQKQRKK